MANGLYDGTLESIPGLGGYLQQQRLTNQQDLTNLQKGAAVVSLASGTQALQDQAKVRAILTSGGDPGTVIQSLIQAGPTGIDAAQKYMGVQQLQNSIALMKGLNISDPDALDRTAAGMALAGRPEAAVLSSLADHMRTRQSNANDLASMQDKPTPVTTTPSYGVGMPGAPDAGVASNRTNIPVADPIDADLQKQLDSMQPGQSSDKPGLVTMKKIPPAVAATLSGLGAKPENNFNPPVPIAIQTGGQSGAVPFTDQTQNAGGIYTTAASQAPTSPLAPIALNNQRSINAISPADAGTFSPQNVYNNLNQLQLAGLRNDTTLAGQEKTLKGREVMIAAANLRAGIGPDGQLTPAAQAEAQAIAEGKISPQGHSAQIVGAALAINPNLSQGQFAAGVGVEKAMPALTQPFNAATLHLAQLGQLAQAMNNGDTQLINAIGNKIALWSGGAAPVDFDALKGIVGQEVTKAIVANGGSAGERDEAAKTIASYSSPAQFAGVINTYQNAMGAQLQALAQRYKAGNGQKDFSSFLLPEAQAAFQRESQGAAPPANPNSVTVGGKTYNFPSGAAAQAFRAQVGAQ